MITYGHEKYIQQTIESILTQQTSFNFELIIANDCSPDHTDSVVKNIMDSHKKGSCINYYSHEENKGMYENFLFALNACKSKYVALCDGDDYWTDPLKLQKQVDFLEAHPDYEVCFTNIRIVDENDNITKQALITDNRKTEYERKDLPIWAPTLTRVFRNRDFSNLPSAPGLDTIMLLWQSQFGSIKFINEITGVYRKHEGGIYSAETEGKRKEQIILTHLASLSLIDAFLYAKYFGMLLKKLLELRFLDIKLFEKNNTIIKQAYIIHKRKMPRILRSKIKFSLLLIEIPVFKRNKRVQALLMKTFNRLFLF